MVISVMIVMNPLKLEAIFPVQRLLYRQHFLNCTVSNSFDEVLYYYFIKIYIPT